MATEATGITHVSDTALLVAACRAVESERPDAFARDPFAARLAGERGTAMLGALPRPEMMKFGLAVRTRFLDELLMSGLAAGKVATVVCMGAGLDTRPWRLELPRELRWIEVDFPAMLDYKDAFMAAETPHCTRERLTADLNDAAQRRAVYAAVGTEPALLITEGLLMYLPGATVEALAAEVGRESGIEQWIIDITTSSFSKALGGSVASSVRHVQAEDCLEGEDILAAIYRQGWVTAERRSYITDMDFAKERIAGMMAGMPAPPSPPPFAKDDPTGVHRFALTR